MIIPAKTRPRRERPPPLHPMLTQLVGAVQAQLLPSEAEARRQAPWYLGAALLQAAIFGLMLLPTAFRSPWVAALDTRQHVYWMRRYLDPGLFPGDPHTDYFQAVAPIGYAAIYHGLAWLGLDPLLVSKLLPTALGLIATYFCYKLAMRICPVPAAAFVAALLLAQYMWMNPDLPTGTPRAFLFPALLAFLYALVSHHAAGLALAVGATAGLYPQYVIVELAILALWPWGWRHGPRLTASRETLRMLGVAGVVGVAGLALYAAQTARFGPVVTLAEAREMAEFKPHGFRAFFSANPWSYWLYNNTSGYAYNLVGGRSPPLLAAALALPLLAIGPAWLPLVARLGPAVQVLPKAVAAVTALFFLAHATLFLLYQPGRYTSHPLAMVGAIAAGLVLVAVAGGALERAATHRPRVAALLAAAIVMGAAALLTPSYTVGWLPYHRVYRAEPDTPRLAAYFTGEPRDILIASLCGEADELPMFAQRKVLVATTMNPYHLGFYRPFRQALLDLVEAQYSTDPAVVVAFLRRYGVTHLMVDRRAFSRAYASENTWLRMLRWERPAIRERLAQDAAFVLRSPQPSWVACETPDVVVLRADAIVASISAAASNARNR